MDRGPELIKKYTRNLINDNVYEYEYFFVDNMESQCDNMES